MAGYVFSQNLRILGWLMAAVNANITLTVQSVQSGPLTDTVMISWLSSDTSDGHDDASFYIGITNDASLISAPVFSSKQTPDDDNKDAPQIAKIEIPNVLLPLAVG